MKSSWLYFIGGAADQRDSPFSSSSSYDFVCLVIVYCLALPCRAVLRIIVLLLLFGWPFDDGNVIGGGFLKK